MNKNQIIIATIAGLFFVTTGVVGTMYVNEKSANEDLQTKYAETSEELEQYQVEEELHNLQQEAEQAAMDDYFASLPSEELTQEEIDGLLLMREEEKLARDVYLTLYDIWNQRIFNNIASSEQTHTNMVADLLNKYDIKDPVTSDELGVYVNDDLAALYNALVERGSENLVAALTVGATVEDLDIKDLSDLMEQTDNEDILAVYQNLTKGSRNHIRAFSRQLDRNGATYEAQYISEDEYQEILGSSQEMGVTYDARGDKVDL